MTPRPLLTPPSSASLEGIPGAMPANLNLRRDRISRLSPLRLSMLSPATDKMVVSKSALVGFCLTSFAGGIVMTLAVDRAHSRAMEPPREPDPVVLKTTPIEPRADLPRAPVPLATEPAPTAPAVVSAPAPAAPTPAAPVAGALVAAAPMAVAPPTVAPATAAPVPAGRVAAARVTAAPVAAAAPAAAEALVVQLASPQEKIKGKKTPTPLPAPAAHAAHKVSAAPVHAVAARKRASAAPESNPTEVGPDADPMLPATTKKKWIDPFDP